MQYPVNQVVVTQLKCKVMMQGNFFYICINLLTYDENEILECFYDRRTCCRKSMSTWPAG